MRTGHVEFDHVGPGILHLHGHLLPSLGVGCVIHQTGDYHVIGMGLSNILNLLEPYAEGPISDEFDVFEGIDFFWLFRRAWISKRGKARPYIHNLFSYQGLGHSPCPSGIKGIFNHLTRCGRRGRR